MSKPHRRLPPFDVRREETDTRIALGSKPLREGQPAAPCHGCLPALVAADMWCHDGHARCLTCAGRMVLPESPRAVLAWSRAA